VIRFLDIRKESFSSVTAFCFAKLAWTDTNRDDLKLLLDPRVRTWSFSYLIVDHRAPPDARQGNLSCIFTTSFSPEHYAVFVLIASI
jgi:hypothetical protein